jgi:hypothetical protein
MITNKTTQKKGAVLLIAILVSSVALAVGFGVYNRTYRELVFASFWKQTQVAFSAADSGLECALYYELHPTVDPVACFGTTILPATWTPGELTDSDGFDLTVPGGGCVNIRIEWNTILLATTTKARGYNTCDAANPRRVERGLGFSL